MQWLQQGRDSCLHMIAQGEWEAPRWAGGSLPWHHPSPEGVFFLHLLTRPHQLHNCTLAPTMEKAESGGQVFLFRKMIQMCCMCIFCSYSNGKEVMWPHLALRKTRFVSNMLCGDF